MADRMSERDELTLQIFARVYERTTVAEQRRIALAAYAARLRHNQPGLRAAVEAILDARRRRDAAAAAGNVVRLRGRS